MTVHLRLLPDLIPFRHGVPWRSPQKGPKVPSGTRTMTRTPPGADRWGLREPQAGGFEAEGVDAVSP